MKMRVVEFFGALTLALSRVAGEGIGTCGGALIGAQLLLTSFAVPFAARAAELRTVTVLSYPDRPAKLPLWLAQDAGIFKKYGLNVEIKTPNSGEAIAEGARNNAADIYVATANWMVSAIGDGADLVFFANTGYSVLKLLAQPSITRPEQLRGKRVGTGEAGSSQDRITRETLAPARSRCRQRRYSGAVRQPEHSTAQRARERRDRRDHQQRR